MSRDARSPDVATMGVVIVAGFLAALPAVLAAALLPEPPGPSPLPAARDLAALEPYLDPTAAGNELAGRGIPASVVIRGDPFRTVATVAGPGEVTGAAPRAARWTVSAIMVTGARRTAIINDQLVRPGERLEGGGELISIGTDHVVIMTPDGQRRRLDLER